MVPAFKPLETIPAFDMASHATSRDFSSYQPWYRAEINPFWKQLPHKKFDNHQFIWYQSGLNIYIYVST